MRLLKFDDRGELTLTKNLNNDIPKYAILSHTWLADDEEVTFEDLRNSSYKSKPGYTKIKFCGEQARKDGWEHFWVDTCCIDKSNSTELSEAIISMFRWYQEAEKCYVYLEDVSTRKRDHDDTVKPWQSSFRSSKWFTRGWTLQELLAPGRVDFYSRDWDHLGDKATLQQMISEITKIPVSALTGGKLSKFGPDERFRWADTRRTSKLEDRAYCLMGVLDVSMTVMYGERDKAWIRLKDEVAKCFRRQLDDSPAAANRALSSTEKISQLEQRRILLESLAFDQMDTRRSTIKNAQATTCKWLLAHPTYVDWLDPEKIPEHLGVLWINGKPGAGKSTLVKYAYADAINGRLEDDIILSFFFNARGDELEKSTLGMYRALVSQLFAKAADLEQILDDIHPSAEDRTNNLEWTIEVLQEVLSASLARMGQRRLKCFIDALDECDEQRVREMVEFFELLGQQALAMDIELRVCFASRHYPTIDPGRGQQMTLENQDGHAEDLLKYVRCHLRAGKGKDLGGIINDICAMANGVFMWAVLVVDILNAEYRSGRIFAVKKRLKEIPSKLSDLFKDILTRDQTNMADLLLCLRWLLYGKRPLRREEFYFAMVAGLDPDPENMGEWDPQHITPEDMNVFVLSSSKGLAELTRSKTPVVQFIHESVKDFLIKENGIFEIWPDLKTHFYGVSHNSLKECCQHYLRVDLSDHAPSDEALPKASSDQAKAMRQTLTSRFPFLEYAMQNLLYHANEAVTEIPQDQFLSEFPLRAWLKVDNVLAKYDTHRHTLNANLIYVLAERDYARLIRTMHVLGYTIDVEGERHKHPLRAALANGHRDAALALLHTRTFTAINASSNIDCGSGPSHSRSRSPFLGLIEEEHQAPTKLPRIITHNHLTHTNLNPGRVSLHRSRALILAAEKGYDEVVQILLSDETVHIDVVDTKLKTALMCAAERGQETVVHLLLSHNADINIQDREGRTALVWAVESGQETMVRIFLGRIEGAGERYRQCREAIATAARNGHATIMQILLSNTDTEHKSEYCGMALHTAAKNGHREVVRLLIDNNANIEAKDSSGNTALIGAAYYGHQEVVRLLLDHGADIDTKDNRGRTALLWAIIGPRGDYLVDGGPVFDRNVPEHIAEAVIVFLLNNQASVKAYDIDGRTALIWAAAMGRHKVVSSLLDRGADFEARDNKGHTALDCAVEKRHPQVVEILLARGAHCNIDNKTYSSLAEHYRVHEINPQNLLHNLGMNGSDQHT